MKQYGVKRCVVTLCIGGDQGIALAVEALLQLRIIAVRETRSPFRWHSVGTGSPLAPAWIR
jgi:hypothetical protein